MDIEKFKCNKPLELEYQANMNIKQIVDDLKYRRGEKSFSYLMVNSGYFVYNEDTKRFSIPNR
jgi:hypothetical protein